MKKVRAKRIDNRELIEGFLIESVRNNYGDKSGDKESFIINGHYAYSNDPVRVCFDNVIRVDAKTVGRCVDIEDKNGRILYQGDVVNAYFEGVFQYTATIEEDTCNPCHVLHYKYRGDGHDCYEYDFVKCNLLTLEWVRTIHE
jgi:hypothetical protein